MTEVGWPPLDARLDDAGAGLRGQAFSLLWNLADCRNDVNAVFEVLAMALLLDALAGALESRDTDIGPRRTRSRTWLMATRQAPMFAPGRLRCEARLSTSWVARCAALGAITDPRTGAMRG